MNDIVGESGSTTAAAASHQQQPNIPTQQQQQQQNDGDSEGGFEAMETSGAAAASAASAVVPGVSSLTSTSAEDFGDELARLKRKEKHMAPIDCTGVSSAYGLTWHCRRCDRPHSCKSECRYYRPVHQPRHVVDNSPAAAEGLPQELVVKGRNATNCGRGREGDANYPPYGGRPGRHGMKRISGIHPST